MSEKHVESDVRSFVRERYGKIAQNFQPTSSGCCAPTGQASADCCQNVIPLYEDPHVLDLPPEVTGLGLGCGDPITLAALEEGQTVLDLGSGGGIDCFLAARRVGPSGHVIGVDMTPAMLEKARANQARLGVDNVEFRLGEIEHLPVADQSVDVIISNCVINLSPDKPQVLREAFRVLRPGGRLAISDMVTSGPLPQTVKDSLSAWAGCVAGAIDMEQYRAAVSAAGFSEVVIEPVPLDQGLIDQAIDELGLSGEREKLPDPAAVYGTVLSARITAVKTA